ncbi:MAG TPA: helix-turn-helix transcriptional regulator [Clostridiales bacterium]|jgi:transcriptional regulator with XRE-family HTH domain|nr:helix-turn-helix transcriptional regulator [Clostridiales bacterium]HOL78794.1 helix-turn-helix transcriptional regulator [Clostridiales bacterium]HQA04951.1 helix-turn-helix transcriptional regulator [Clostridiales bacterium]HQD72206.1 helix-turn-helix transcriptional regulator [Clostridiales bacterium]
MSSEFGSRLTSLRHERGVSQKEVAEALGVSQALLSHYEKGIRECGLDFIRKASNYYDVTADYLLGLSENRRGLGDLFESSELPSDEDMKMQTIYRAIIKLGEIMTAKGGKKAESVKWYLAFSAYHLLSKAREAGTVPDDWFSLSEDAGTNISNAMANYFSDSFKKEELSEESESVPDILVFKTLISNCEKQIKSILSEI